MAERDQRIICTNVFDNWDAKLINNVKIIVCLMELLHGKGLAMAHFCRRLASPITMTISLANIRSHACDWQLNYHTRSIIIFYSKTIFLLEQLLLFEQQNKIVLKNYYSNKIQSGPIYWTNFRSKTHNLEGVGVGVIGATSPIEVVNCLKIWLWLFKDRILKSYDSNFI